MFYSFFQENRLDVFVVDILLHAHAKEYLPHFARHRIDELKMRAMTKERLREVNYNCLVMLIKRARLI